MRHLVIALSLIGVMPLQAQENTGNGALLPPPELPQPVQSGKAFEPDIRVHKEKNQTIEEYRLYGRLYMVKITPANGISYYLSDNDGDGHMETEHESPYGEDIAVPQKVIFSW